MCAGLFVSGEMGTPEAPRLQHTRQAHLGARFGATMGGVCGCASGDVMVVCGDELAGATLEGECSGDGGDVRPQRGAGRVRSDVVVAKCCGQKNGCLRWVGEGLLVLRWFRIIGEREPEFGNFLCP